MKEQGKRGGSEARGRGQENGTARKASGLAVWSWVLYDFSNTIFSISILSYFFPLWLGDELGAGADTFNYLVALSALLVVLTAPVLGSVADLTQRRRPYLVVLTVLAVILTAGLDFSGGTLVVVAALFVAADVCYQSALVFYNALLPVVSAGRGAGRISGYGTAVGYLGTILALVVLTYFVENGDVLRPLLGPLGGWLETGDEVYSNAFVPTAALYLVFSLPVFFLVPDPAVRARRPLNLAVAYRDVIRTVKNLPAYVGVGTFIVATVLYTDAANTAIANMALYGRVVFEMDGTQVRNLLLFSTVFAVVGSTVFGFLTDRVGPKRSLIGVLVLWLVAILLAAAALGAWMLFLAGPIVGIALGGMWTVGRVMLVALSPPEKLGEFFGLFSLAGKVSAVFGPALTAVLLFVFEGSASGYRISIGSLAVIMAAGLFFLLRVPDARPEPNVDEFAPETAATLDSQAP
jgi:UMF1 family MFS transporter